MLGKLCYSCPHPVGELCLQGRRPPARQPACSEWGLPDLVFLKHGHVAGTLCEPRQQGQWGWGRPRVCTSAAAFIPGQCRDLGMSSGGQAGSGFDMGLVLGRSGLWGNCTKAQKGGHVSTFKGFSSWSQDTAHCTVIIIFRDTGA
jgi:hypothetical protein